MREQSFAADRAALHKAFQTNKKEKWYCSYVVVICAEGHGGNPVEEAVV